MKLNDEKINIPGIVFCRNKTINAEYVSVRSNEIRSSSCVKLLSSKVYFDQKLLFDYHADELICRKTGRKLSVLARLTKTLAVASEMLLFHTSCYSSSTAHFRGHLYNSFCSRDKMKEIEKIQRQTFNDFKKLMLSTMTCLRKPTGHPKTETHTIICRKNILTGNGQRI